MTNFTTTCQAITSTGLTVVAPSDGTVIITGQIRLNTNHNTGTNEYGGLYLGATSATCSTYLATYDLPAPLPSYSMTFVHLPLSYAQAVSAGTYTFHLSSSALIAGGSVSAATLRWSAIFIPN
jgi:hypothetical protein